MRGCVMRRCVVRGCVIRGCVMRGCVMRGCVNKPVTGTARRHETDDKTFRTRPSWLLLLLLLKKKLDEGGYDYGCELLSIHVIAHVPSPSPAPMPTHSLATSN